MYGVDLYGRVRLAVLRDEISRREAARRFGIDRGTVAKILKHSSPPGYTCVMPVRRPKLADDHVSFIERVLDEDETAPRKQRHTARRIFERLRDERGYDGGYSTVRDHLRPRRLARKEAFIPLTHPPGHAQADFGEAVVILGGVERKVRFFVMDLPQSDAIFVKAYHAETAEAFCDGHVSASPSLAACRCRSCTTTPRSPSPRSRGTGPASAARCSPLCSPTTSSRTASAVQGRGNDKGKVEGMVGYARRSFLVPIPRARDIDELNALMLERCRTRQEAVLRRAEGSIADRLARDQAAFLDLPGAPFEACEKRPGRVSSQALVRYRNNDYSVPVAYAHREVMVKGYVGEVVIAVGAEEIARHRRPYETADFVFNSLRYPRLWSKRSARSIRPRRSRAGTCPRSSRLRAGFLRPG